jgi:excisionase family DNA binding protein
MIADYLTTREAGKFLGVTPLRVVQLIELRRLPATRFGQRNYAIKMSDLETFKVELDRNRIARGVFKRDEQ